MALNDRYTKHLVVSDSTTVNPSQMPENVILVNSAGQKISTKTDAELNSRFMSVNERGSVGAGFTWLGDSLTGASAHGASVPRFASLLSGGRISYGTNAGMVGDTSAQMLARITDVTSTSSGTVFVLAGTNDLAQSVPLATTMANLAAIVLAIRSAGKKVVLATVPPMLAKRTACATLNLAIRLYALKANVPLVDFYSTLIDPSTGDYLSAYSGGDGIHPNQAGYSAMGAAVVAALLDGGEVSPLPLLAAHDNTDGINLNTNPLAINISTDIPTTWSKSSSGAGRTYSVVTGDSTIKGNWGQIALAASSQYGALLVGGAGSGWSVGDKLLFQGRCNSASLSGSAEMAIQAQFYGATIRKIVQEISVDVTGGIFSRVLTVPASTTWVDVQLIAGKVGTGGTGTFKIAQTGTFNLTTLGMDALGLTPDTPAP